MTFIPLQQIQESIQQFIQESQSALQREIEKEQGFFEKESAVDDHDDDMDTQLNPDAVEFVPLSPTASAPLNSFANAAITSNRPDLLDDVVSQSPRKATAPVMDDITLPRDNDFTEISQRPSELFGDELNVSNGNGASAEGNGALRPGSSSSQCSYQEMNLKEAMHGDEKQELAADSEPLEPFDRSAREEDPMERSFYGSDVNPFASSAEVDLNAVQLLPESDDEGINGGDEENAIQLNGSGADHPHDELPGDEKPAEEQTSITQVVLEMANEVTAVLNQNDNVNQAEIPEQPQPADPSEAFADNVDLLQRTEQHVISQDNFFSDPFGTQENKSNDFQHFQDQHHDILQFETQTNASNLAVEDLLTRALSPEPVLEEVASEVQAVAFESSPLFKEDHEPIAADPLPVEPTPVESFYAEPVHFEPTKFEPVFFEPTPIEPALAEPLVTELAPVEPATVEEAVVPPVEVAAVAVAAATVAAAAAVSSMKSPASKTAVKSADAKKAPITAAAKRPGLASTTAKTASRTSAAPAARATSKSPTKTTTAPRTTATATARPAAARTTTTTTSTTRKPLTNGVATTTVKKTTTVTAAKPSATRVGTTSTTTTRTASSVAPKTSTTTTRVPLSAR